MRVLARFALVGLGLVGGCATALTRPEPPPPVADLPALPAPPLIAIVADNRIESAPAKMPEVGAAIALLAASWRSSTGAPAAPRSQQTPSQDEHEHGDAGRATRATKAPGALMFAREALAVAQDVASRGAPDRPRWVDRIGDEVLFLMVGRGKSVVDLSRVEHLHASSTKAMPNGDPVAVEGPLGQIALLGRLVGARTVVALRVDELGADTESLPLELDAKAAAEWRTAAPAIATACEQASAELKARGEAYESMLKKGAERRESELSAWPGMLEGLRAKLAGADLRAPFVEARDEARRRSAAFVEQCAGRAAATAALAAALERVAAAPAEQRTAGVLEHELATALSSLSGGAREQLLPLVDRLRANATETAAGMRELRAQMTLVDVDTAKAIAAVRAMRRGPDAERGADELARDLVDVLAPVKPARKGKP